MEATMQAQNTTSPTHVIHTSTLPQQAAPKPANTVQNRHHGFPLFENYMKMARFNSSEREVLEKCLIPTVSPHRSSISSYIRPQGGDSMSHLLDLDDDYLLKTLDGDSDFSDSISAISSLSLNNQLKRKKKRSERWRTNSRRASANALIIMKHDESHHHMQTEQTVQPSSERVNSIQTTSRISRQHTPRDYQSGEEVRRSRHGTPKSHRSLSRESLHSRHSSNHSHHSDHHSNHGSCSSTPSKSIQHTTDQQEEKTTTSWSERIEGGSDDSEHENGRPKSTSRPTSDEPHLREAERDSSRLSSRRHSSRLSTRSQHSKHDSGSESERYFTEKNAEHRRPSSGGSQNREKHRRDRGENHQYAGGKYDAQERSRNDDDNRGSRNRKSRRRHRDNNIRTKDNDEAIIQHVEYKLGRNMRATSRKSRRKLKE